jgi:hypothetical protein
MAFDTATFISGKTGYVREVEEVIVSDYTGLIKKQD